MASEETQQKTATEKETASRWEKKEGLVHLTVHPQQPVSELDTVHVYSYTCCVMRQEITKREKQSGGDSELKIDYRWTDYHKKGWGKVVNYCVSF